MIQMFESEVVEEGQADGEIDFEDSGEFNDYWDEQFGEFEMGDYSYWASQVLFKLDPLAYRTEMEAYGLSLAQVDT